MAEYKASTTTLPVMRTFFVSTLTSKNQVTLPESICKHLGLKAGDPVAFKSRDGLVYLQKSQPVDLVMTRAVSETLLNEWSSTYDEHAYRDL